MAVLTVTYNSGRILLEKAEFVAAGYSDGPDALAAIVLSFSALEAFVAELEWRCSQEAQEQHMMKLGVFLEALEANRAQIRHKLDAVFLTAAERRIDWGRSPYQDLTHLKLLRDWSVHPKPVVGSSDEDVENTKETRFFVDRGLVGKEHIGNHAVWSSVVLIAPVAKWACTTVRSVIDEALAVLPDSDATQRARDAWRQGPV